MVLSQKEKTVIEDLKTQEQSCIEKYSKYSKEAKDTILSNLFAKIAEQEQKHYDDLCKIEECTTEECVCTNTDLIDSSEYNPKATYSPSEESEDKKHDCYLATDCIGTEKLVSSEYNSDVFCFANSAIRKLLARIQVEEQNHAEMLWKYKTVNGMA